MFDDFSALATRNAFNCTALRPSAGRAGQTSVGWLQPIAMYHHTYQYHMFNVTSYDQYHELSYLRRSPHSRLCRLCKILNFECKELSRVVNNMPDKSRDQKFKKVKCKN